MKRIEKYLGNDFGIGGASNYERSTIDDALKLLAIFYGGSFQDTERASLIEFLNRNEGNLKKPDYKHFNRDKIDELMDEAEELKEMGC